MSAYCPIQVGIACACGKWFAYVEHFVDHARSCKQFAEQPESTKDVYAALLHLKEGALTT